MIKNIPISVKDKIARSLNKEAYIVCGNSDFKIEFTFDEEWNEQDLKTARFSYGDEHEDVPFTGTVCDVPKLFDTYEVKVGVFAGNLKTSTDARIPCKKSALCAKSTPREPKPDTYEKLVEMINEGRVKGDKGEQGFSILEYKSDFIGAFDMALSVSKLDGTPRVGDFVLFPNDYIGKITKYTSETGYLRCEKVCYFQGEKGKDCCFYNADISASVGGSSKILIYNLRKYMTGGYDNGSVFLSRNGKVCLMGDPVRTQVGLEAPDAREITVLADYSEAKSFPSITDHGAEATPFVDINFGKANEMRKAFFEQSLLLGWTHYGDGFMQDKNGYRMLMPTLSQNETIATERGVKEVKEELNTKFGYYNKTGADQYEIKCNGLYIIFANNSDLKLCKADGTVIVSGAQQMLFMTAPYNGKKGENTVFVAMGMHIYKSTFSLTNLKIPVEAIQVELDDGSYITAESANTQIYISEMVKGN